MHTTNIGLQSKTEQIIKKRSTKCEQKPQSPSSHPKWFLNECTTQKHTKNTHSGVNANQVAKTKIKYKDA